MSRVRTGIIYSEMTNKGRCSTKYVRGAKPIYCFRWVAEITVNGKRYRELLRYRADIDPNKNNIHFNVQTDRPN